MQLLQELGPLPEGLLRDAGMNWEIEDDRQPPDCIQM